MKNVKEIFETYEPKRQNRFIIEFDNIDLEPWMVSRCSLPKFVAGEWDFLKIGFNDVIVKSVAKELLKLTKKEINNLTLGIKMLDPKGETVEKWIIIVDSIEYIEFGNLSYTNEDFVRPILSIKPKTCEIVNY